MAIPDQLPESHKEPTEEMRREHIRALKRVWQELYLATERLNIFLENTPKNNVTRHVHMAKTEVTDNEGGTNTVEYFSLWTDDDTRLTPSGNLLRSDYYPEKYQDIRNGADKSQRLSNNDLRRYSSAKLVSLATHLEKFLKSKDNPAVH